MIKNIIVVSSLFFMTGCGLGHALHKAGTGNEQYRACVLEQIEHYSEIYGVNEPIVGEASEFVISSCKQQEEAYVLAMTDLAMTMTGNMVSRKKFLEDEEATLRGNLRELAENLIEQER